MMLCRDDVDDVAIMELPLKELIDVTRERVDVTLMRGVEDMMTRENGKFPGLKNDDDDSMTPG